MYNKMATKLTERIPLDKALFLNDMTFSQFKPHSKRCSNDIERKEQFDKIKRICREVIDGLGVVEREYSYSKQMGDSGRLFSNGIQGLMREFRGFLMGDTTTDIDMVNAHPVILRYICRKHNINCPNLEYYINNRDKVLSSFDKLTRDEAKTLFLKSLNNDKVMKNEKNENFRKFDNEIKKIQCEIIKIPDYNDIMNTVPTDKNYNINGSKVNRVLCYYENKILQEAVGVLNEQNIEISSYMFDGCMLYGNHYENAELLNDITRKVNMKFDGLDMKWSYKPHETVITIPEGWKPKPTKDETKQSKKFDPDDKVLIKELIHQYFPYKHIGTHKGSVEFVLKNAPNKFMWINGLMYCWTGEKWEQSEFEFIRYLTSDCVVLLENILERVETEIKPFNNINREALDFITKEINSVITKWKDRPFFTNVCKTSESFITRKDVIFDNKPFLLGFNNGVLDLMKFCEKNDDGEFKYNHAQCFRPYKYDDYMTLTTGYDFKVFDDKKDSIIVDDLVQFFDSIMPNKDHQLLLLQILASGLDGLLYQKFFMLNGEGGNGKGSIFEIMKMLLGGYYKQGKNAILNEMGKANGASEDIMDLKGKRFVVFEELGEIDNDEIKRLTGGGETTGSRKYGGNETFKLQATILGSFNEPAKLKKKPTGNSELRRLIDLFFCRNFTSDINKVGMVYKKNNLEVEWMLGDRKYETEEWRESIKYGFLHMLLNVHRNFCDGAKGINFTVPADVMRRTEAFLDAQNIFSSIFNELYEKVDDEKAVVKVCDIWESISNDDLYKSLNYREKKKYNRKYFDEWLERKVGQSCFDINVFKVKIIKGYKVLDNGYGNYEEEEFVDDDTGETVILN